MSVDNIFKIQQNVLEKKIEPNDLSLEHDRAKDINDCKKTSLYLELTYLFDLLSKRYNHELKLVI